ncbi:DUF3592 domain-containing protein [Tunturibacter empetritectus]|uniref:DUF3592 domain-containing protein n=1 Tax=Tunturiibacter lichenicola TaxID=2051959 RepID=A0A7W8J8D5_9BACT|nr:DUF3592 domain-containing protein [Edaphobacter lichenicola]MBB5344413.1 hypothetical protein [Edaphobacter lichenicola]
MTEHLTASERSSSDNWKEVTATVLSSTYHPARLRDLSDDYQDNSFFVVSFSYTVDGKLFVDEYERSEPLDRGHEIVILYNSSKPGENNLSEVAPTSRSRIVGWVGGAILAALIIYLAKHFDLPDEF